MSMLLRRDHAAAASAATPARWSANALEFRAGPVESGSGLAAGRVVFAGKTAESTETEESTKTRLAPQWHVIVHDDPVSLMQYVTTIFMDVFAYSKSKAERLMMEVHEQGRSIVWTGARERAEVYVSKLQAFHLLTTLEPGEAE